MSYQYTYLLMGLVFSIFWILLFWARKDIRKPMLIMSLVFTIAGPLYDLFYTTDWWKPLTLTHTSVGFESLIVAFMLGGIASVLYEEIFKKRTRKIKVSTYKRKKENNKFYGLLFFSLFLFLVSFYILRLNTYISTIISTLIPLLIVYHKRPDLIADSLLSGFLLLFVACVTYNLLNYITPGWVNAFWYFKNVPRIFILNMPIDDVTWYLLAGTFISPLYLFWKEERLFTLKTKG